MEEKKRQAPRTTGSGAAGGEGEKRTAPVARSDVTMALEGGKVLANWDDLLDLAPGETVLVPLESPLGEAVWVWKKSLAMNNPVGQMGRGIREILLGLHENRKAQIIDGMATLLSGFARLGLR